MPESETEEVRARAPVSAGTPLGVSNSFETGSGPRIEPAMTTLGRKLLSIIAESGITPNEITVIGLLLVIANCAAYLWHRSNFWLGGGLAMSFGFDSLDGTVARYQHSQSAYGSYLDAVADRYEEIATYFVIAWVNDWWMASFVAMTGSMLISYNKARVALERKIDNKGWPDMLERHARSWILCAGLLCDVLVPIPKPMGGHLLLIVLVILGPLTHIAALQRFFRARRILLSD